MGIITLCGVLVWAYHHFVLEGPQPSPASAGQSHMDETCKIAPKFPLRPQGQRGNSRAISAVARHLNLESSSLGFVAKNLGLAG